ncbi:hypothetical protein [Pseudoclavibacter sp. Z016]|uniref:hypothetical protein n=1 Tax=Pseudoclavibacter sp. Z016 TaxID=2080581 RepID=UPI0011B0D42E|nr:hypothetical protein [Pseudoclavibacter sp. Z016]
MQENLKRDAQTRQGGTTRRSLVAGAAWTVPILSLAVATPARAASRCVAATPLVAARPAGATFTDTTFVVPAGVTSITYTVVGAAGGGQNATNYGGAGERAEGTLTVVPGQSLVLRVGAGGTYVAGQAPPAVGGTGFGNGGASGPSGGQFQFAGGSGGGGSAILVGGAPLVVAGGGGGAGTGINGPGTLPTTVTVPASGGDGGFAAANTSVLWNGPNRTVTAIGGAGGSASAAGTGGGTGTSTAGSTEVFNGSGASGQTRAAGGAGGTGGSIAYAQFATQNPAGTVLAGGAAGGGGGGGYTGGGGGGVRGAKYLNPETANYSGLPARASGGGGGGSFVSSASVGGVTPVAGTSSITRGNERNTTQNTRLGGRIELRYEVCA